MHACGGGYAFRGRTARLKVAVGVLAAHQLSGGVPTDLSSLTRAQNAKIYVEGHAAVAQTTQQPPRMRLPDHRRTAHELHHGVFVQAVRLLAHLINLGAAGRGERWGGRRPATGDGRKRPDGTGGKHRHHKMGQNSPHQGE